MINFNSPMMERVTRNSSSHPASFSLPRKGRIRFILALIIIIVLVRLVGVILHKVAQSSEHTEKNRTADKPVNTMMQKRRLQLSDLPVQLSKKPTTLSSIQVMAFSDSDSIIVHTSIDTALKTYCEKLMSRYNPLYGALVALDPVSGRILSLVSYTNDTMPDLGTNLCLKSFFPAASTFKTITAAAAIEYEHFTADCTVKHRGRTSTLYKSQIAKELDWTVDLTFSQAFSRSVNAVFARIGLYEVGKKRLLNLTDSFGFNTPIPGELECEQSKASCTDSAFEIAEFASGFNQRTTISPLHGALIASAIAQDGSMPVPTLIDSILQLKDGKKKYERTSALWRRVIRPSTAQEMQRLMQMVTRSGTARKQFNTIRNSSRFDDFIYGGKTGSVDKDKIGRVDWFIGFAVHPQKIDERIAIGALTVHGAYWTVHSSYLAAEAMRFYLKSLQEKKKKESVEKVVQVIDSTQVVNQ